MKDDLTFDVHYGYWFNLACERYYKHIDFATNFVQLVGGSSAALGAVNGSPIWVVWSGLALASCAAISLLMQPAVKAEQHLQAKCRYLSIKGKMHSMTADQLAAEVAEAQRAGNAGVGALAKPAFNSTLQAMGRSDGLKDLGFMEKVASFVA
ncbi:MAG: hypothetical protein F9K35_03610 [Burkholderiaceae bacterium]|nr:MAG: hypothetical protein F9K35_03610 [Burkholderiaceae bacterium]